MKKTLPIGYENFKEIIDKNLYYVDKTGMIKELLDRGGKVNLFTRPRRFGKTLNLSMLKTFFETELDECGKQIDNRYLFDDLEIASYKENYMTMQGCFPVINLSLKSAKQPTFALAYVMLKRQIAKEYTRHQYVLESEILSLAQKRRYQEIMEEIEDESLYIDALEFLSYCLSKYHKKNVVMLIDEYDVPPENSYLEGFYQEMVSFIRSLFESALKTNPYLEFAVITGCLRISRERIFTGLNNLKIFSVLHPDFGDSFGFREKEVRKMLSYYNLNEKYEEVKEGYDGYQFGRQEIYNPWSIVNYVDTAAQDVHAIPVPYWSNTSSNSIVKELVCQADYQTREELQLLISGETIEKRVHEDITYEDIHESTDNLWNFLFFTGYLKSVGERQEEGERILQLAVPNTEIHSIYRNTIMLWFEQKIKHTDMTALFTALEAGDCEKTGNFISGLLMESISFYDYSENYYHGFMTGLLKTSGRYAVYSNRESGLGRSDIILKTHNVRGGRAIILELKAASDFGSMEILCHKALKQIEDRKYAEGLLAEGYRDIKKYGVCFYKKECLVMKDE